ncbi:hypothetical protein K491DRAFT_714720 [Lophiostoma macrostomum CBS 122681]|uniref:Calcineurin-like phosphoesterase domain-containing protein n=1 Tax=Lophiostoma macrostomum CBS 122681 TaxID=1314788 RepID=A0A6A6TCT2_9PLEO|nr:hypothetical protein K491DRAFT_714720 [Lophiostoma macrostomum CBS 122681]
MATSLASNDDAPQTTRSEIAKVIPRYHCPFMFKQLRYDREKASAFVTRKHFSKEHIAKQRQRLGLTKVPTVWEKFYTSPLRYPTRCLFHLLSRFTLARSSPLHDAPITVVCLADTQGRQPDMPRGHILLHVGSLTRTGTREEIQAQINWLDSLPHRKKFVVAGQNDHFLAAEDQGRRSPERSAGSERGTVSEEARNGAAIEDEVSDKKSSIEEDGNEQRVNTKLNDRKADDDHGIDQTSKIKEVDRKKLATKKAHNSETTTQHSFEDEVTAPERIIAEAANRKDNNEEAAVWEDVSEEEVDDEGSDEISVSGSDWPITDQDVKEAEQWSTAERGRTRKQAASADGGVIAEKDNTEGKAITPDRVRVDSAACVNRGTHAEHGTDTTQCLCMNHHAGEEQQLNADKGNGAPHGSGTDQDKNTEDVVPTDQSTNAQDHHSSQSVPSKLD